MTGTTYALEQYRRLIADGYRFDVQAGRGAFLVKRLEYVPVPPHDARAVRRMSDEADIAPDTECRECGAEFPAPPVGKCPQCGGRYLRRLQA